MGASNDVDDIDVSDDASVDSFSGMVAMSQDYGEVSPAKPVRGPSTKRARNSHDKTHDVAESQDYGGGARANHGVDQARPRAIAKKQKRRDFWKPLWDTLQGMGWCARTGDEGQELFISDQEELYTSRAAVMSHCQKNGIAAGSAGY